MNHTPDELAALLRTDGPHSDDYTAEVARVCGESVRVLNHATFSAAGLSVPQTVYTVTGGLGSAAMAMPQTLDQMMAFLDHEADAGRLACDNASDPLAAVERAHGCAETAKAAAYALGTALDKMQAAISRLYVPEGDQS